jgi:hypothetical protein
MLADSAMTTLLPGFEVARAWHVSEATLGRRPEGLPPDGRVRCVHENWR